MTVVATETNIFEITSPGISVECVLTGGTGEIENGASEGTVITSYAGTIEEPESEHCGSSVGAVNIEVNGCGYVLTGNTTGKDESSTDATVWIECPDENEIVVTTELVSISIPEQTPTSGGLSYTNLPEGDVNAQVTVTGITYSCSPHFFCTLGGIATEGNNADYTGAGVASAPGPIQYSEE